jgi:hypothetical protein
VSLHRVDARFLLPTTVGSAAVLGDLVEWREGLAEAGVELWNGGVSTPPDLVVATADRVAEALGIGAEMLLVEGGAAVRPLRRAGLSVHRYLPRPTVERPEMVVPLDQADPGRDAAAHWAAATSGWRRARNGLAEVVLAAGVFPSMAAVTAVALRRDRPPALVQAAHEHGAIARAWLLTPGRGDELSRNVFHLFPDRSRSPAWVLKFARVPGYTEPFDRDEAGLTLARDAGTPVADHAPRLLSRFATDGLEASIETAAIGERLTRLLARTSRARGLESIQDVAAWIVASSAATRGDPDALGAERSRLQSEVLQRWSDRGADVRLVTALPQIASVLQHNDLGPWTIVTDGRTFTAVDWESARRHGFPLWDLAYFLTEALAGLDRVSDQDRDEYTRKLYRGTVPSSPILFEWIRRAVQSAEVPPESVGRIVTLCWLHHSLSHERRGAAMARTVPAGSHFVPAIERIAGLWLGDPELGADWSRWQA